MDLSFKEPGVGRGRGARDENLETGNIMNKGLGCEEGSDGGMTSG